MATFRSYYEALGDRFDDIRVRATDSLGTGNTAIIGSLSTALANASTHAEDDVWLYNATAGEQRQVRNGGLAPSTGTLTFDPVGTTVASASRIVLTRLFPITSNARAKSSYLSIVNKSLKRLIYPDRLTITIVPGQQAYSLSTYVAWLDREERFGWPDVVYSDGRREPQPKLLEPGPTGGIAIPGDWRRPHLRLDGPSPYLEIEAPFAAGTTGVITLNVMRPGDSLINGAESTVGLAAETDTAIAPVQDVLEVGTLVMYEELAARGASSASGVAWADRIEAQREIVKGLRYYDSTSDTTAQPKAA